MASNTLQLGLIQMDCKLKDKQHNLARTRTWLESLPDDVDIACLPEFFNSGYHLDLIGEDFYRLAEPIPGATTEALRAIAHSKKMAILANIPEADTDQNGVLYNTTFLVDRQGQLIGRYRKTHLFPPENHYFRAGDEFPVFDLSIAKVGTATCFDHAFPEVFSTLTIKGAQIIFIPSAVPVSYEYVLNLRTRARAQDNQIWVAAVNRVGTDLDVTYCGLSKVVNPRGEVVAEASADKEEILVVNIDLATILQERQQEPVLRTRRPSIYR